ncbi:MAG: hypothetical protein ABSA09_13355 [Desulfobaccales bacterium]
MQVTAPGLLQIRQELLKELCHCARESLEIFSRMVLSLDECGSLCYHAFEVMILLQE